MCEFDFFTFLEQIPSIKYLCNRLDCLNIGIDTTNLHLIKSNRQIWNQPLWICGLEVPLKICCHFFAFQRLSNRFIFGKRHDNALNLFNLNGVRRIEGMRKVLIGVPENVYLLKKWKAKNVNYDLVEITRLETIRAHFIFKQTKWHLNLNE